MFTQFTNAVVSLALAKTARLPVLNSVKACHAATARASALFTERKYAEALAIFEHQVLPFRKKWPDETPEIATTYTWIGHCHKGMGRMKAALENFQTALRIRKKLLGPIHEDIAMSLNNIASVKIAQGKVVEATNHQTEAAEMCKELFGMDHEQTIQAYSNLASLLVTTKRYDKALECFEQVYEASMNVSGKDDIITAMICEHVGALLAHLQEDDVALKYTQQASAFFEKELGRHDEQTIKTRARLEVLQEKKASAGS